MEKRREHLICAKKDMLSVEESSSISIGIYKNIYIYLDIEFILSFLETSEKVYECRKVIINK